MFPELAETEADRALAEVSLRGVGVTVSCITINSIIDSHGCALWVERLVVRCGCTAVIDFVELIVVICDCKYA